MTRAERRRAEKKDQKKATYNFTQEQLDTAIAKGVEEHIAKMKQEATDKAVNDAMVLMLGLPIRVLVDKYPSIKVDDFADELVEEYEKWQNGDYTSEELKDYIWDYGGIRIETEEYC